MSGQDLDALKQQMFTEGVNKRTFNSVKNHYLNCGIDNQPFNADNPPTLLECGHVIC